MLSAILINSLGCKLDEVTGDAAAIQKRNLSWLVTIEIGDKIVFCE
jgi:hypothetical protein